jgi:hypothetical protein
LGFDVQYKGADVKYYFSSIEDIFNRGTEESIKKHVKMVQSYLLNNAHKAADWLKLATTNFCLADENIETPLTDEEHKMIRYAQ